MRRRIFLALVAFFALPLFAQSKHFEATAFSADFPHAGNVELEPHETDSPTGRVTVQMYSMTGADGIYGVMYTDFPAGTTYDTEIGVQSAVKRACNPAKGAVVSRQREFDSTIGDLPARGVEFWCTSSSGSRLFSTARIAWQPNRLWQLVYVGENDDGRAKVKAFFDSVVVKH